MNKVDASIVPVILSGGAGTRLWPMSRALYPKQLLPLVGENSLLQDTARRVADDRFAAPVIVCNDEHRFVVAENLRAIGVTPRRIVLEPVGRNTAPAAAVAALMFEDAPADTVLLLMPSDHVIADAPAFAAAIDKAAAAARAGKLATFGIAADKPETGYGYIKEGPAMADLPGVKAVARFVEKPDARTAAAYLAEGGYHWNSGIFAFTPRRFLDELTRLEPAMVAQCRAALAAAREDLDFLRLDADAFAAAAARSIDYAVMEHTADAVVVPVAMGWSDVGSWSALWEIGDKDDRGNVAKGDVIAVETYNSYLRTDDRLTAVIGLDDVIVVVTDDAVMVADKDHAQDVRQVVAELEKRGRDEHKVHATVHRPWGHYRGIDVGARFQVKHISVTPGAALSLQKHHHRSEHWIVVSGTAKVTRGDEVFFLHEDESTYIPVGVTHRLENPGRVPLRLIEVQTGSYLGEDDIVRLEDTYGRDRE